ncbi:MAG: ATP-dependent Clp protease adaptor ClpS [Bacteroidales bacterium]
MDTKQNIQESQQEHHSTVEKKSDVHTLLLYNDDYNTFEHVIDCLVSICEHQELQAEQCAFIVHYNGKCDIKHGSHSELKPIKEQLIAEGLSVVIEK